MSSPEGNTSLGAAVCRICLCGESSIAYLGTKAGEPLISPCHCKGTLGLFHRSCLEHWLSLTLRSSCEICNFRYQTKQRDHSFFEYVKMQGWNKPMGHPKPHSVWCDVYCFSTVTPICGLILGLCLKSALITISEEDEVPAGMIFIIGFIAVCYFCWLIPAIIIQYQFYARFRDTYKVVEIVDQLDAERSHLFNSKSIFKRMSASRRSFFNRSMPHITSFFRNGTRSNENQSMGMLAHHEPVINDVPQLIQPSPTHYVVQNIDNHGTPESIATTDQSSSGSANSHSSSTGSSPLVLSTFRPVTPEYDQRIYASTPNDPSRRIESPRFDSPISNTFNPSEPIYNCPPDAGYELPSINSHEDSATIAQRSDVR